MKPSFLERTYKLTLISTLLILLLSCSLIPCNYYSDLDNFDQKPEFNQIVGEYQLDIEPPASRAQARLILKSDSTFILKEIPIGVLDVFNSDYKQNDKSLQDINGTWKIWKYEDRLSLQVDIQLSQIDEKLENIWADWNLYKKDNKPVVFIILGDPDSCEALKFIKKE